MRKAIAALAVGLVLIIGAGWARAQSTREEAKGHFAAGEKRFQSGDYQGAIAEFRAADKLVPSPILTYNVALSYDRLGDAKQAARLYRQYLERRPDAPNRAQVEARIATLSGPQPLDPFGPAPAAPAARARQPAPEGDGLAAPRREAPAAAPGAPGAEPRRREYDDVFGRRIPGPAEAAPAEGPAAAGPPVAAAEPPGAGELPGVPEAGRAPLAPPVPTDAPRSADRPLYMKWWFWAVIGVGAVIAVDVAVHASSNDSLRGKPAAPAQPGLLLFHF